jgi:hypothetical protein
MSKYGLATTAAAAAAALLLGACGGAALARHFMRRKTPQQQGACGVVAAAQHDDMTARGGGYVEHVNVTSRDSAATCAFLLTAFPAWRIRGSGSTPEASGGGSRRWLHVGSDSFYVAVEERNWAAGSDAKDSSSSSTEQQQQQQRRPYVDAGINHVGFCVPSMERVCARLLAKSYRKGIKAGEHKYRKRVYFLDATGTCGVTRARSSSSSSSRRRTAKQHTTN